MRSVQPCEQLSHPETSVHSRRHFVTSAFPQRHQVSPGVPRCAHAHLQPFLMENERRREEVDHVCKKDGGRKRVVAPAVDVTSSGAFVTKERVLRCFTKEAISATVR